MATLTFPTMPSGSGIDSSKFLVEYTTNTIRQEVEGSYAITRPRSTRSSIRMFSVGFTYIPTGDKTSLESFWQSVMTNAVSFWWVCPQDSVTYRVRFKGPLKFTYVGQRSNQRWDCSFQLEQV